MSIQCQHRAKSSLPNNASSVFRAQAAAVANDPNTHAVDHKRCQSDVNMGQNAAYQVTEALCCRAQTAAAASDTNAQQTLAASQALQEACAKGLHSSTEALIQQRQTQNLFKGPIRCVASHPQQRFSHLLSATCCLAFSRMLSLCVECNT